MFSIARSTGGKRDFEGAMSVVDACMDIVKWSLIKAYEKNRYAHFKFWALENPKGYLDKFIGRPAYSFSPWEFGDPYFKNTHLWGYFNPPVKTLVVHQRDFDDSIQGLWSLSMRTKCHQNRSGRPLGRKPEKFDRVAWASPKAPEEDKHLKLDRAGIRAITPKGFAEAFFRANR